MEVVWKLWRSDDGGHYASRQGFLTDADLEKGLVTLDANTEEELQIKIKQQAVLQLQVSI